MSSKGNFPVLLALRSPFKISGCSGRPDATPSEVCAEYYRMSSAAADPAVLVELPKEAPPEMADDLLVIARVSSGEVSAERAGPNFATAC